MTRKKKPGFRNPKMLSSRIELDDYIKFEEAIEIELGRRVKIQEVMNIFARSVISGSIVIDGDRFVGGDGEEA